MEPSGRVGFEGRWHQLPEEIAPDPPAVDLHPEVPHSARMYDYYLGGKDNFPIDRAAAEGVIQRHPTLRATIRQNRAFMARATTFLAARAGVRQFLDVGTGLPTSPNLHEIAQQVAPASRVVYIDNDPVVLTHARALLTSCPEGHTAYIDADLRNPETILAAPEMAALDLGRPVALCLFAVLHFVPDEAGPYSIVARLLEALPSGSYLALSHATADLDPDAEAGAIEYRNRGIAFQMRTHAQVAGFFTGLDLIDPGLTGIDRWRPDTDTAPGPLGPPASGYGAVARKP